MDVSRISRGKVELEREVVEVDRLVDAGDRDDASLSRREEAAADARRRTPGKPLYVEVDVVRMKQVLSNLIHNSSRYSPEGGAIAVERAPHRRDRCRSPSRTRASASTRDMLPRVFDLFAQASSGLAREGAGLGVGLTIVQRLVLDHGGTVTREQPRPGHGQRVRRHASPRWPAPTPATEPACDRRLARPARAGARRRRQRGRGGVAAIWDADDLSGYECVVAGDGWRRWRRRRAWRPTSRSIDIGLPLLDGFGVARALRGLLRRRAWRSSR